jgi:Domain of unknown function (DUF4349)
MTHPDDTTTIDRDLDAVDTALASGSAEHHEPAAHELQELALVLAAEAPRARPEFAEQLRGRVEQGFPKPPRAVRRAGTRRVALGKIAHDFAPLAGVVATILLIVGVTLVAGGGSNDDNADSGASSGGGAAESASGGGIATQEAPGGSTADSQLADPFQGGKGFAPGQANRRIERTFSMELAVPVKEMTRVADQVTAVAYRHGGFVLSSSVNSGDSGGGGDFSLRIPTAQLRPTLRDLGELAPVTNQSQEGRDVTRQHVTARDRLQAARAERRSLLRRLAEADTDAEAEAIRRRLDLVAGEISGLRSQLRDLRLRTNYAVVNVTLAEAKKDSGSLGSLGDALDDAGSLLAGFAGVTIRVLALALPLGVIALVAWLAARVLRRRRRESALV